MTRRTSKALFVLPLIATAILRLAQPSWAASPTSVVTDPVGDVKKQVPGYQDVAQASMSQKDHSFVFSMDLAAAIPASPPVNPGTSLEWDGCFDTDPSTFPQGFPVPPGQPSPCEFYVGTFWDGTSFFAILIDRRPLLSGGQAITTSVPFTVSGAEVTATVDSALVGDPSCCGWLAFTYTLKGPIGSEGFTPVDFAPDVGFASWPS